MPLPDHFPTRAGQANYALRFQLEEYVKTVKKMEKERIPTTVEEVLEPSIRRSFQKWLDKRERKRELQRKLEEFLRRDASLYLLASSSYPSRRRGAIPSLPGFENHYPNPNYLAPALEGYDYFPAVQEKRSMMGKLFGKEVPATIILPPVGRRLKIQAKSELHNKDKGISRLTLALSGMGGLSTSPPSGSLTGLNGGHVHGHGPLYAGHHKHKGTPQSAHSTPSNISHAGHASTAPVGANGYSHKDEASSGKAAAAHLAQLTETMKDMQTVDVPSNSLNDGEDHETVAINSKQLRLKKNQVAPSMLGAILGRYA